ncbi:MAG TPA: hypothetical protein VIL49_07940 [Capillimicrobium sp.]|jgi:hypothetical protein
MASDTTSTVKSSARATTRKAAATKRSTSAKKAAATRANKTTSAAAKRTTTKAKRTTKSTARTAEARTQATTRTATREAKTGFDRVGDVAERAVLTGVGAALTARDSVREVGVNVTSRAGVERQVKKAQRELETDLRRFERRGSTARNQLEREVKRARTKVERELRQRRNALTKVVDVDVALPAPDALAKNAKAQADLAQARVGNVVETAQLAGAQVVARVSERVAALV